MYIDGRRSGSHLSADREPGADTAAACTLDAGGFGAQLARYRRLGRHASSVDRLRGELRVRFDDHLPAGLLGHTLEVERRCCPFVHPSYDAGERLLILTVETLDQEITLDSLFEALS
jgi:hypothetical protein